MSQMIEVRLGLRNTLRIDASLQPIVRERNGWHRIDGLPNGPRRVRYEMIRGRLHIESGAARLRVQFRLRHSGFNWRGRRYDIRPMILFQPFGRGRVSILCDGGQVVNGRLTFTGVRLDYVAPELEPLSAELALGIALRGQAYLDALAGGGGGNAVVIP